MKMNPTSKWSEFQKILHHGPRKEWKKMIQEFNPALNETSSNDLKLAFKDFLKIYAPDPQAKNTLLALFEKRFRKPIQLTSKLIGINVT